MGTSGVKVDEESASVVLRDCTTLDVVSDCLESGNNKKALQEADKVLRKTPNQLCFKALKALSLLRLGRNDEADVLVEEIAAENPSNESTLQAMTVCYKEREECTCSVDVFICPFRG